MANISNISLPFYKCMKCRVESDILLSSHTLFDEVIGLCDHVFCQRCFRLENIDYNLYAGANYIIKCPCCHTSVYKEAKSIEESILIGEATAIRTHIPLFLQLQRCVIPNKDIIRINEIIQSAVDKLILALQINPTNFDTLYSGFITCVSGKNFLLAHDIIDSKIEFYNLKLYEYHFKLLDHPAVSEQDNEIVRALCYFELTPIFILNHNFSAALKYSKLAYDHCLRSSDHTQLDLCKATYTKIQGNFAKLPPLRFAVGDEVEFLHEVEAGSEWKRGKVVELYYRERDFDIPFTAPYRLQLLDDFDSTDQPPVCAWVKADIDRYVRKEGVRSIEDTRYQARLGAKVEELARAYSEEFMQDIYLTLAEDQDFVVMLHSEWQIVLSPDMLELYRTLIMYRQPLTRTDTGYHVPSSEEVIAGIRAYFDPIHLSIKAAPPVVDKNSDSKELRAVIIELFRGTLRPLPPSPSLYHDSDTRGLLFCSIRHYSYMLSEPSSPPSGSTELDDQDSGFTVPMEVSEAISKVSVRRDFTSIMSLVKAPGGIYYLKLVYLIMAWSVVQQCLDDPTAGPAWECPFVYFFVKYCLNHGFGVPKHALVLYDRMNMQLSREFIRCAYPTCELNKLDQSAGQVKFKQCGRCRTVIYCSKECQVAHYPEHKRLCTAHSTG